MTTPHVYLAGPEVFYPDALDRTRMARELTRRYGFEPLTPVDNQLPDLDDPALISAWIYKKNIEMIKKADFVIANLTPFRGPSADVGTVWEAGFAIGRGMPVWGFSDVASDYCERVQEDGMLIEDFGGYDNLMITESVQRPLHATLEQALAAASRHFATRILTPDNTLSV